MHELFAPQGSNPLSNLKIANPRCSKVEFDRTVRSNVLVIEGDLTQSRVQIPKEDRPVSSLQLNHSLVVLQIMIPSSGQFLLELNVSNSPMTRMRLSAATFISRADVVDAKGMAHAKIPLVIPRNCWVQIVFHVGGIFTHLFRLPTVKWIDSVILAGSCKVRKVLTCADEATAIESKPGGMLLFAVPAYGPPVWQTAGGAAQPVPAPSLSPVAVEGSSSATETSPTTDEPSSKSTSITRQQRPGAARSPPPAEVSTRTLSSDTRKDVVRKSPTVPPDVPSQLSVTSPTSSCSDVGDATPPSSSSGPSSAPPSAIGGAASPLQMRFLKGDDGTISFSASNAEKEAQELSERRRQLQIIEKLRQEAEALRIKEECDRQRRERESLEGQEQYVRIVETSDPAPNTTSGRRGTTTAVGTSPPVVAATGDMRRSTLVDGRGSMARPPAGSPAGAALSLPSTYIEGDEQGGGLGSWNDDEEQSIFSSMLAGGIGHRVIQTLNSGGKPIVVPMRVEDADALLQAAQITSKRSMAAAGSMNPAMVARKPRVSAILNKPGAAPVPRRKKASLPPSMMLLTLRPHLPGDVHPSDDYDPEVHRKVEPDVGYGCGFMDVLHGGDEEDEEDYEEE